jgi:hypothetical protein
MSTSTTTTTTRTVYGYRRDSNAGELPILVGILAVLIGLLGLIFLVIGILVTASSLGVIAAPAVSAYAPIAGDAPIAGLITVIFGGVLLAVATGLWDLETWALYLTGIVVAALIVLLVLAGNFGWSLALAAGLLIYLVAVRSHFY